LSVLEAGNVLGFIWCMRRSTEGNRLSRVRGEGVYKFVYYLQTQDGKRTPLFQVTMSQSIGRIAC